VRIDEKKKSEEYPMPALFVSHLEFIGGDAENGSSLFMSFFTWLNSSCLFLNLTLRSALTQLPWFFKRSQRLTIKNLLPSKIGSVWFTEN